MCLEYTRFITKLVLVSALLGLQKALFRQEKDKICTIIGPFYSWLNKEHSLRS